MPDSPRVLVFDVNGTLSDLTGLRRCFTAAGAPAELAPTWFAGVLRDGFALTVAGAPARFADVATAGLRAVLAAEPEFTGSIDDAVESIMAGLTTLTVHPDVVPGIRRLAEAGHRLVTLSVGGTSVAEHLLAGAGVRDAFERVLSIEDAGFWKPDRRAYEHAVRSCGLEPGDLMLVAVHPWDIDGAHRAGLRTTWIDRVGVPYPDVFAEPEFTVAGVGQLADVLADG